MLNNNDNNENNEEKQELDVTDVGDNDDGEIEEETVLVLSDDDHIDIATNPDHDNGLELMLSSSFGASLPSQQQMKLSMQSMNNDDMEDINDNDEREDEEEEEEKDDDDIEGIKQIPTKIERNDNGYMNNFDAFSGNRLSIMMLI